MTKGNVVVCWYMLVTKGSVLVTKGNVVVCWYMLVTKGSVLVTKGSVLVKGLPLLHW